MNPVCKASFKAVFAAFLCLGLDALAESADSRGDAVLEKAAVAKPVEASVKGEDGAAAVKTETAGENRAGQNSELARINAVAAKIEARKQAIVAENEAAAKINGEIEALARDVQKIAEALAVKQAELGKMLDADEAMAELNREMADAYVSLRAAKEKMREQRIKSHREHLMLPPATTSEAADGKSGEGDAK